MEAFITIYKIDSQWEFAVYNSGKSNGLDNSLEGDGWDVQVEDDMSKPMADSCWCLVETNEVL